MVPKEEADTPDAPEEAAGEGKRRAPKGPPLGLLSWPAALLRMVRAWLEPWVMVWRWWGAFSDKPPPKKLRALLEWVFLGRGLCLYVR